MSSDLSASQRAIDNVLCRATRDRAFGDARNKYFSSDSVADIFEVTGMNGGIVRSGVRNEIILSAIEEDVTGNIGAKRTRIYFIHGFEDDPERLPCTSAILQELCKAYDITPRFADFLTRQHMPGRAVNYDLSNNEMSKHELWYSAVIRTHADYTGRHVDQSRLVVNWQRMCVWSSYTANGNATYLILRCPDHIKMKFYDAFSGPAGTILRDHPMLAHAFIAEHLVMHTYDFLEIFSDPLYEWENKAGNLQTAEDYTRRSKAFLALSRQIYQVATDYEILAESIGHLQRQSAWFNDWLTTKPGETASMDVRQMRDAQRVLDDAFENLLKDVKLIGTYSNLYLERSKIGVSECYAMVTQRDADINLQMAHESTTIARASHQDNQSLRIIQILSMIFLPASLISSIFGMGFFNTQPDQFGNAQFTVSGNWWWYLAISIPITAALWIFLACYGWYTAQWMNSKLPEPAEPRRGSAFSNLEGGFGAKSQDKVG